MELDRRYLMGIDCSLAKDTHLCGGKAANIHKMRSRFKELFPGGVVLTIYANQLSDAELSKELFHIKEEYGENSRFAVRSSATVEDGLTSAFPGQFRSLLDVGFKDLLWAVRQVQMSAAEENVIAYCRQNGINSDQIKMAVLIMPMVGCKDTVISGAIFTCDPESGCADNYISASKGYGDSEMSGLTTPEIAVVRGDLILRRKPQGENTEYILNEEIILKLSKYASDVENIMREMFPDIRYVDIEYVIDGSEIFFVQVRPETAASFNPVSFKAVSADAGYRAIVKGVGYAASRGAVSGKAHYCDTIENADKITANDILLCHNTSNHWEPFMRRCAAIVTAYGGANCHTAVCAREMGLPCITGIGIEAMRSLRKHAGKHITVDATARIVYEGMVDKEHLIYQSSFPDYEKLNFVTEDELFQISSSIGQTRIDENGYRWLKKPRDVTSARLHEIHRRACLFITDMLGLFPVKDHVHEGIFYISFADAYGIIERLQAYTDEELSGILNQWADTMRDLTFLSENLNLNEFPAQQDFWDRLFMQACGFMSIAYSLYLVISNRFERALAKKKLPEPYNSRIHHSVPPGTPLTVAQKGILSFNALLEKATPSDEELCAHALRYRFIPKNCIEFDATLPIEELRRELEATQRHIPVFFPPEKEEYFVNDRIFSLTYKNMRQLNDLKESSHHVKNYCQRLFIAHYMTLIGK